MANNHNPHYTIADRELIAQSDGLRVQILTLAQGECVPWHYHSDISDTFVCLDAPVIVTTRTPDEKYILQVGDKLTIPPTTPHEVTTSKSTGCRFLLVQGVGTYDYIPA